MSRRETQHSKRAHHDETVQLNLWIDRPHRPTWTAVDIFRVRGYGLWTVRGWTGDSGVRIVLEPHGAAKRAPAKDVVEIDVNVRAPDPYLGPGRVLQWDLQGGPGKSQLGANVFDYPLGLLKTSDARLTALLRILARHTLGRCDYGLAEIARRFPADLWFPLYRDIVGDGSGRLAQLACVCPGALTLVRDMTKAHESMRDALPAVWRHVVEGRRLPVIIDSVLEAYPMARRRSWPDRDMAHVRMLVRRAASNVKVLDLIGVPLGALADDIPAMPADNAIWFTTLSMWTVVANGRTDCPHERALVAECVPFLSRHAVALAHQQRQRGIRAGLGEMLDYVLATTEVPTRRRSLESFLGDVERWHQRAALGEHGLTGEQLKHPVPPPPCPGWKNSEFTIEPIMSVGALVLEGIRMHNCVASRAHDVLAGISAIYAANVRDERLTVEVAPSSRGWFLREAKGFANRELTSAERNLVGGWVLHLQKEPCSQDPRRCAKALRL